MNTLAKKNNLFTFPTLLDDLFEGNLMNWKHLNHTDFNATLPSVNIKESTSAFIVEVAAPGLKKDDFNISLDGNTLKVWAEIQSESEESNKEFNYSRKEFNYSSFKRTFTLPKNVVDNDAIEANYNNGVLTIQIPKKELKKDSPKLITIK